MHKSDLPALLLYARFPFGAAQFHLFARFSADLGANRAHHLTCSRRVFCLRFEIHVGKGPSCLPSRFRVCVLSYCCEVTVYDGQYSFRPEDVCA